MTRAIWTKTNVLQVFLALQCLDVLTTLVFLSRGVKEGNPLLSWSTPFVHVQWVMLIAAKLFAVLIGIYCYRNGKFTALRIANIGYAGIVGWNLLSIAAAAFAA